MAVVLCAPAVRLLRASPWPLLSVGCRSSCSLAFRVRKRRWLHDHITNLVTDIGQEGFADEAVLAGGTGTPSILGFSTRQLPRLCDAVAHAHCGGRNAVDG